MTDAEHLKNYYIQSRRIENGKQYTTYYYKDLSNENEYFILDVKSLYPFAMLNNVYPCGDIITDIDYFECNRRGLIGFYLCKFDQLNLNKNILPRRINGLLDWNYKNTQIVFLNSIDIGELIDNGCNVKIINNGEKYLNERNEIKQNNDNYCFSKTVDGKILFRCMELAKKIKEEQDIYKETKDPEEAKKYNPALRQMAKLILNALSGKVIQNKINTKIHLLEEHRNYEEQERQQAEGKIISSRLVHKLSEEKALIEYTYNDATALDNSNMPIYLGILIYAYARKHMYNNVIRDYNIIYQDTDSAFLHKKDYELFIKNSGHMIGAEFGKFELEIKKNKETGLNYKMSNFVALAAKNYFIQDSEKDIIKKGFKGINIDRDIFIDKEQYKEMTQVDPTQTTTKNELKIIKNNDWFEKYNKSMSSSSLKKSININKFLDDIINDGHAYILTSSLNKYMADKTIK